MASKILPVFTKAINFDDLVKSRPSVTPARAGVQNFLELLDSGFRRNDGFL